MNNTDEDSRWMALALELARQGQGHVEPNPMVGCVIVRDGQVLGRGWHQRFGEPHAEINALADCTASLDKSTFYVTLEPCCHQGKTPPCVDAVIAARPARVVIAQQDPFPKVQGGGIAKLLAAGISVEVGRLGDQARKLNAPYLKRQATGLPWIIAKWAMTLDGKIATRTGSSRWISGAAARAQVHALRGRVDGVMVGSQTAKLDDPLLTARPSGPRTAARIVVDSAASLSPQSQLARTARDFPTMVAVGPNARPERLDQLVHAGCEILLCDAPDHAGRIMQLLSQLGARGMTNILVEGGSQLLATLLEQHQIDEVHSYIAPKLVGGVAAPTPIGGTGLSEMAEAITLKDIETETVDDTLLVQGLIDWGNFPETEAT
ncbi:MAG: bifunctional diaminohydroxyphosphoribosylaminopyrimidine deaminase/5-amino-6-(5-phosphoribosylamino)uracil reductase RibD [Pirellulaceae bacterium]